MASMSYFDENPRVYYSGLNEKGPTKKRSKRDLEALKEHGVDPKLKSPDILENLLVKPATKIQVIDGSVTDTTFLPETLGFVSYIKGSGNGNNLMTCQTVILRRGKSGRPRLDWSTLITPVFYNAKSIIEIMGLNIKYSVLIEKLPVESDITIMTDADFLGWITSKTLFLHHLTQNYGKNGGKITWPMGKHHILNAILAIPRNFDGDPDYIRELYRNTDKRAECIFNIRQMEVKLVQYIAKYNIFLLDRIRKAIKAVENKAEKWDYTTISRDCLAATYEKFNAQEKLWKKRIHAKPNNSTNEASDYIEESDMAEGGYLSNNSMGYDLASDGGVIISNPAGEIETPSHGYTFGAAGGTFTPEQPLGNGMEADDAPQYVMEHGQSNQVVSNQTIHRESEAEDTLIDVRDHGSYGMWKANQLYGTHTESEPELVEEESYPEPEMTEPEPDASGEVEENYPEPPNSNTELQWKTARDPVVLDINTNKEKLSESAFKEFQEEVYKLTSKKISGNKARKILQGLTKKHQ